jgi:hypothetical protein
MTHPATPFTLAVNGVAASDGPQDYWWTLKSDFEMELPRASVSS